MPAGVMLAQGYEQAYVAEYARRRGELAGGPALARVRDAAIERFASLGFPTAHDEEWKYTNLAPFLKVVYEPAPSGARVDWSSSAPLRLCSRSSTAGSRPSFPPGRPCLA